MVRRAVLLILSLTLLACAQQVESEQPADAGTDDAPVDVRVVDHCGNASLEKIAAAHPEEVCAATAECVAAKLGDTCICGLCVTHY